MPAELGEAATALTRQETLAPQASPRTPEPEWRGAGDGDLTLGTALQSLQCHHGVDALTRPPVHDLLHGLSSGAVALIAATMGTLLAGLPVGFLALALSKALTMGGLVGPVAATALSVLATGAAATALFLYEWSRGGLRRMFAPAPPLPHLALTLGALEAVGVHLGPDAVALPVSHATRDEGREVRTRLSPAGLKGTLVVRVEAQGERLQLQIGLERAMSDGVLASLERRVPHGPWRDAHGREVEDPTAWAGGVARQALIHLGLPPHRPLELGAPRHLPGPPLTHTAPTEARHTTDGVAAVVFEAPSPVAPPGDLFLSRLGALGPALLWVMVLGQGARVGLSGLWEGGEQSVAALLMGLGLWIAAVAGVIAFRALWPREARIVRALPARTTPPPTTPVTASLDGALLTIGGETVALDRPFAVQLYRTPEVGAMVIEVIQHETPGAARRARFKVWIEGGAPDTMPLLDVRAGFVGSAPFLLWLWPALRSWGQLHGVELPGDFEASREFPTHAHSAHPRATIAAQVFSEGGANNPTGHSDGSAHDADNSAERVHDGAHDPDGRAHDAANPAGRVDNAHISTRMTDDAANPAGRVNDDNGRHAGDADASRPAPDTDQGSSQEHNASTTARRRL